MKIVTREEKKAAEELSKPVKVQEEKPAEKEAEKKSSILDHEYTFNELNKMSLDERYNLLIKVKKEMDEFNESFKSVKTEYRKKYNKIFWRSVLLTGPIIDSVAFSNDYDELGSNGVAVAEYRKQFKKYKDLVKLILKTEGMAEKIKEEAAKSKSKPNKEKLAEALKEAVVRLEYGDAEEAKSVILEGVLGDVFSFSDGPIGNPDSAMTKYYTPKWMMIDEILEAENITDKEAVKNRRIELKRMKEEDLVKLYNSIKKSHHDSVEIIDDDMAEMLDESNLDFTEEYKQALREEYRLGKELDAIKNSGVPLYNPAFVQARKKYEEAVDRTNKLYPDRDKK